MNYKIKIAASLLITLSSTKFLHAQENVIFGTENYAPYNYLDENSQEIKGVGAEIVRAMLDAAEDTNSQIKIYPWARIYKMAKKTKNVAVFSTVRTSEREKLFHWIDLFSYQDEHLWKLKVRRDINVQNRQDVLKYSIAVSRNGVDEQVLRRHYGFSQGGKLIPVTDPSLRLNLLFRKRADLINGNSIALKWNLARLGFDFKDIERVIPMPESAKPMGIAFNLKTDKAIIARYRRAMGKIISNGVHQEILNRWIE